MKSYLIVDALEQMHDKEQKAFYQGMLYALSLLGLVQICEKCKVEETIGATDLCEQCTK